MKKQKTKAPWGNSVRVFLAVVGVISFGLMNPSFAAAAEGSFTLGVVTFLSGAAAGPFGIPSQNAAELIIEGINKGTLPAPYATKGIAGMNVETVVVDEAGGTTKQSSEFRNLVQRKNVDAVVGYISSGDILAVAPVAEELKTLLVVFDTGTPRLFEDNSYKYVFRSAPHSAMDNIGAARYVLEVKPNLKTVAGINQNYAWGQDSWRDFIDALKVLKPDVVVQTEQFPKLFAGQYGAELSTIMMGKPDVIHSSFWGGDMEALMLQGAARGVYTDSLGIFTCGETAMFRLAGQIPEGTILGAKGPFGVFAPPGPLNDWFRKNFIARFGTPPTYPAYRMAQAILGLKNAADKAALAKKGKPTTEEIIAVFENSEFEAPSGTVKMALGKGHQAIQDMLYGQFTMKDGEPSLTNIITYPAECVNPPEGVKSADWIQNGMKQAPCK